MATAVKLEETWLVRLDDGRMSMVARTAGNDYVQIRPGKTADGRLTMVHQQVGKDSPVIRAIKG